MWGKSIFATRLLLVLAILAPALVGVVLNPTARAQTATDFRVTLDAGAPVEGSTDVIVAVDPATSLVAALQATLTYDAGRLSPTECVALSALGACTIEASGAINLATVSVAGWDAETSLFRIAFASDGPVHPQDVSLTITEALTVAGDSISGSVVPLLPIPGDVSCNRSLNILDAVLIAQHVVGTRSGAEDCPLGDGTTELNLAVADVNGSGTVSIADAVLIAQCVDGRANQLCPE